MQNLMLEQEFLGVDECPDQIADRVAAVLDLGQIGSGNVAFLGRRPASQPRSE